MYIEQQIETLSKQVKNLQEEMTNMKRKTSEKILTPKEFAELVQINENTVYTWIRQGKIEILSGLGAAKRIPMSQFYKTIDPDVIDLLPAETKSQMLRKEFLRKKANRKK